MDEMKGNYLVSRISRRWPLTIFYSILNIAGINSQLIYHENNKCNINRREFLQTLGKSLTLDYLQRRKNMLAIPTNLRKKIQSDLCENELQHEAGPSREGRCYYCDRKKNIKTKNCENYICKEHTYCRQCDENIQNSSDNSD